MARRYRSYLFALLLSSGMLAGPTAYAQEHFTACVQNTGNSATLILPASSSPRIGSEQLKAGDEVALFTAEGVCAGVVTWHGANAALTVWGDDIVTEEKDGYALSEALSFRLWDAATGTEYHAHNADISVTYDTSQPFYRLDGLYEEGAIYVLSSLQVAPAPDGELPQHLALHQNYPNPFNPETTIPFDLPEPAHVTLKVYNVLGQEVATLVAEELAAGRHSVQWDAAGLPSGMYLYQLKAGQMVLNRSLSLVK